MESLDFPVSFKQVLSLALDPKLSHPHLFPDSQPEDTYGTFTDDFNQNSKPSQYTDNTDRKELIFPDQIPFRKFKLVDANENFSVEPVSDTLEKKQAEVAQPKPETAAIYKNIFASTHVTMIQSKTGITISLPNAQAECFIKVITPDQVESAIILEDSLHLILSTVTGLIISRYPYEEFQSYQLYENIDFCNSLLFNDPKSKNSFFVLTRENALYYLGIFSDKESTCKCFIKEDVLDFDISSKHYILKRSDKYELYSRSLTCFRPILIDLPLEGSVLLDDEFIYHVKDNKVSQFCIPSVNDPSLRLEKTYTKVNSITKSFPTYQIITNKQIQAQTQTCDVAVKWKNIGEQPIITDISQPKEAHKETKSQTNKFEEMKEHILNYVSEYTKHFNSSIHQLDIQLTEINTSISSIDVSPVKKHTATSLYNERKYNEAFLIAANDKSEFDNFATAQRINEAITKDQIPDKTIVQLIPNIISKIQKDFSFIPVLKSLLLHIEDANTMKSIPFISIRKSIEKLQSNKQDDIELNSYNNDIKIIDHILEMMI